MSWDVFGLAINQVVGDALKAFAGPGAVPLSTGPGGVPFPLEPAPAPPGPPRWVTVWNRRTALTPATARWRRRTVS